MSGIGFSELIILFLIGLIVLGPERLPRVANQLGTWLGQARRMTRVMKRQLEEEIDFDLEGKRPNIKPPPAQPAPHDDDSYSPLHDPIPMADDADAVGTDADDTDADDAQEKKDA